ncbi:MAG: hypothetical protein A2W91_18860 [Bacteroidetes bacterium GWF2_38_335]|nr:MAG: hypothetical protein A2W91_18860 [Bacteroidetes bacterium GWF2_38_335]OFY78141.1 MAG: hypothetical protein A2281_04205 [Bacteroidetes bacterium RIFOXYA12_FULL_38_20]HBS88704.1 CDP-diacylglycerol--serine O-phosphatidyltransferase [Bacteroidales bacterium]
MIRKQIPNIITLCNLAAGSIAIVAILENRPFVASLLIGIAVVLDFMDGFAARMLKAGSEIGKQLDSLADLISFGLAPAVIMYKIMQSSLIQYQNQMGEDLNPWLLKLMLAMPFLIVVFSAIRLAKFNTDDSQTYSFKGLPTPANAIVISSLPLILLNNNEYSDILLNVFVVMAVVLFQSAIMVAPIEMFSLKMKSFGFKGNEVKYIFVFCSLAMIIFLKYLAFPLIIWLYILLSLILQASSKKRL